MTDHELHTLAGPYALDSLTEDERSRFDVHLAECAQCQQDAREMRETAARLGAAAQVTPRPELRQAALTAARRTSQLAPVVPLARRRRLLVRLLSAAAVIVIAGATVAALAAHNAMQQLHHSQRQDHMIATVLNAPDAIMLTARISTGGKATIVMSHAEHAIVFTAHGLRALPRSESYELWLMGPEGNRSAGMLKPQPGGMAGPSVVSGLKAGDMIGLTVEPAGGAPHPTSSPILLMRLAHR